MGHNHSNIKYFSTCFNSSLKLLLQTDVLHSVTLDSTSTIKTLKYVYFRLNIVGVTNFTNFMKSSYFLLLEIFLFQISFYLYPMQVPSPQILNIPLTVYQIFFHFIHFSIFIAWGLTFNSYEPSQFLSLISTTQLSPLPLLNNIKK